MAADGSESVDQFLARIANVNEGRDEAGEERKRRMEEEFLKNRTERQARRLERARSLSPSKTGPPKSSPLEIAPAAARDITIDPPVDFSPRSSTLSRSNAVRTSPTLEPTRVEGRAQPSPPGHSASLSRNGTLSWQQRPSSREGGASRTRPLSTIATIKPKAADDQPEPSSPKEQTRSEIAASLSQKDPAWFRQTQDRGANSAAYRKNQVEDTPVLDVPVRNMRLPGLSREGSWDGHGQSPAARSPAPVPSPKGFGKDTPSLTPAPLLSTETSPTAHQRYHAAHTSQDSSPTLGVGPGRSPSPTKGLGGFVQSAMMRRSDSVNKRWTVQAGAGLQRGDSVAGARPRSGFYAADKSSRKEGAISPSERASELDSESQNRTSSSATARDRPDDKPSHEIPKQASPTERPVTPPDRNSLARSPSKALDTRRWSPTKSSWLESTLLSKQEPPKLSPKKEEQPEWMVNLQRSKSKRDLSPDRPGLGRGHNVPADTGGTTEQRQSAKELSLEKSDSSLKDTKLQSRHVTATETPSKPVEASLGQSEKSMEALKRTGVTETRQPPVLKPKPQTPPKTDFRANLKSRAATGEVGKGAEPEFKAVFGKLKPAQTKNYVAPDTFKDNILSGKAALSVTGGPQKSQRVDEFKESILQKKQAMKASAEERQSNPQSTKTDKPEAPLPEALQRRRTLHKATPSITKIQNEVKEKGVIDPTGIKTGPVANVDKNTTEEPGGEDKSTKEDRPRSLLASKPLTSSVKGERSAPIGAPVAENTLSSPKGNTLTAVSSKADAKSLSSPRQQSASRSTPAVAKTGEIKTLPSPVASKIVSPQLPQPGLPAGSKLASRLNPNLAALISRGNSPGSNVGEGASAPSSVSREQEQTSSSNELTHMTKGRARGPKRRAPKGKTASATQSNTQKSADRPTARPLSLGKSPAVPASPTKSLKDIRGIFSSEPPSLLPGGKQEMSGDRSDNDRVQAKEDTTSTATSPIMTKTKPPVATKSPNLRKVSSPTDSNVANSPASKSMSSKRSEIAVDNKPNSLASSNPSSPIRNLQASTPVLSPKPLTVSKFKINAPKQPVPEKSAGTAAVKVPGIRAESSSETAPEAPKSVPQNDQQREEYKTRTVVSPSAASELVNKVFSPNLPMIKDKAEFDTQALLENSTREAEKINTLSNTIWELSGDGKKSSMPPQQEHILYEDCMYLMVHTFEANGNKQSEVLLWCGDKVSGAAIEDAQIFCKKDARDHGVKLEVLEQGREPSRFFQALGGIVITRRSKVSALYMLCGRKHLGHIAFDEVDFKIGSLCSGFPYLISAQYGNLFLWKGQGSAVDEVGCARLIGMDLGLTGEMQEIDEGEEPDLFWEAFAEPSVKREASIAWQQRNDHAAYPCSLYRVEHDRPKSAGGFWGLRSTSPPKTTNKAFVEAITPFCQRHLESGHIYILDAYRAVYVLLDEKNASSKSAEVVTALHLAQEIAMLSPSIQGRSLLPSCFVVFGQAPADVSHCFRKWSPRAADGPTTGRSSYCVRLEDVMQALGF